MLASDKHETSSQTVQNTRGTRQQTHTAHANGAWGLGAEDESCRTHEDGASEFTGTLTSVV